MSHPFLGEYGETPYKNDRLSLFTGGIITEKGFERKCFGKKNPVFTFVDNPGEILYNNSIN